MKRIMKSLIIAVSIIALTGPFAMSDTLISGAATIGEDQQAQGQGQQQNIIDNSVNEAADLNNSRAFAIPGEINFPGTPGYFGEATPGQNFIPLNKMLMFTTVWDVDSARNMLKGNTGRKDIQIRDLMATDATTKFVYCTIKTPADLGATFKSQVSIGAVAAENDTSISADVLAAAIVGAADRGANYIMFMAEGVNRELDASGWGIGLNYTQANLQGETNRGAGVATGGTGYSRGWAGYNDLPWLQFTYLNVDGLADLDQVTADYEAALAAEAAAEEAPAEEVPAE